MIPRCAYLQDGDSPTKHQVACRRKSSISGPTGAMGGSFSVAQRAKLQELSGAPRPDLMEGDGVEDSAVMISVTQDAAVAEREAPKGSCKPCGAVVKAILPVILFFVAIQFHACLECIVIGVQVHPMSCLGFLP